MKESTKLKLIVVLAIGVFVGSVAFGQWLAEQAAMKNQARLDRVEMELSETRKQCGAKFPLLDVNYERCLDCAAKMVRGDI